MYYPRIFSLLPNVRAVAYLCHVTFIDFYSTFITPAYIYLLVLLQMRSVMLLINEYDDDDADDDDESQ